MSAKQRTFDLLAISETLIDLISEQTVSCLAEANNYTRFLGGQVTNVALDVAGIRTDHLRLTSEASTTIVINARQTMPPDFVICRVTGLHIFPEERHLKPIKKSRVVHTSAFALARHPARTTILQC